MDFMEYYRL